MLEEPQNVEDFEWVDVLSFMNILSYYFIEYSMLLKMKEQLMNKDKNIRSIDFCIGKIIKIKFRTDDLNVDIVKRLEKDEPECKCNISKIGKAKSFIEKNYDFIQKIIKMLEIINDKINCKDFSYKLGETKQEIPIGEYKIIFDILGKYKIYYKNIELDNLNYGIEEQLEQKEISYDELNPIFKNIFLNIKQALEPKKIIYK